MSIEEATEDWLNGKTNLTQSSINNKSHRLSVFSDWCKQEGVIQTHQITSMKVHDFKVARKQEVALVTLRMQLGTIRQFLRRGERMNLVPDGVGEYLELPKLKDKDEVRETKLSEKEADEILSYLKKFDYGSFDHAMFYLMWHTAVRISTVNAFDVDDFYPEPGYIEVVHRPDTGIPLKKKETGQREINLKPEVVQVLEDWIEMKHPEVRDDHGRMPLLGTEYGRAHTGTIRKHIYKSTRPCVYSAECPHGYDPNTCDAAKSQEPFKCPSSHSPHAIRKGSITAHRNSGIDRVVVSDRADVSDQVLDKHYDMASESERRERRRDLLRDF